MRQLSAQLLFVCITASIKSTVERSVGASSSNEHSSSVASSAQKRDKANVQIAMSIQSVTDVDFKQSSFKASVSLLMVMEKSGRPPGSLIVKYEQYQYPFSDLQFSSNKVSSKSVYRLITSAADGTTSTRSSYELEVFCPFNFKRYPFDTHLCSIDIYAARHPGKQLSLSWFQTDGAKLNGSAGPTNMMIELIASGTCDFDAVYAVTELNAASARFACLRASLRLYRPLNTSFIRFFLPTILLVALTWITFYIDRRRLQSRITIPAFSSLLTFLCTPFSVGELPPTAYITAADVWMLLCNIFIYSSLLETLAVHLLMQTSQKQMMLASRDESVRLKSRVRHERRAARRARSSSPRAPIANGRIFELKPQQHNELDLPGSTSTSNYETLISDYFHRWSDYYSVAAARTDIAARVVVPSTFILVTALYFTFYLLL